MNSKDQNVDKDNLTGSAIAIDAAEYIIQDILEDFFDCYNPAVKDDQFRILYEFPRCRAKANVLLMLLNQIRNDFKENKITCYL